MDFQNSLKLIIILSMFVYLMTISLSVLDEMFYIKRLISFI